MKDLKELLRQGEELRKKAKPLPWNQSDYEHGYYFDDESDLEFQLHACNTNEVKDRIIELLLDTVVFMSTQDVCNGDRGFMEGRLKTVNNIAKEANNLSIK